MLTGPDRDQLAAAAARLEAVLPPDGMPRTRVLLDRARDLEAGLPIGMTARGLVDLHEGAIGELDTPPRPRLTPTRPTSPKVGAELGSAKFRVCVMLDLGQERRAGGGARGVCARAGRTS